MQESGMWHTLSFQFIGIVLAARFFSEKKKNRHIHYLNFIEKMHIKITITDTYRTTYANN
jgi:hypothetical protein